MKERQDVFEEDMLALEAGGEEPPQRLIYRKITKRIQKLKTNLENGDNSPYNYFDNISECILSARAKVHGPIDEPEETPVNTG